MYAGGAARVSSATMSVTNTPSVGVTIGLKVSATGSNIHALYNPGAAVSVALAAFAAVRLAAVHGSIVPVVSCSRHSLQVTRMRPVPSHSGNAEEKRPPGEITGMVIVVLTAVNTAFWVAACSAKLVVE